VVWGHQGGSTQTALNQRIAEACQHTSLPSMHVGTGLS
jgi:hypothetical protein